VIRLQPGAEFIALDGKGHWWLARLQEQQAVILEQIDNQRELPSQITLAIAMPKGSGMEEIIKPATEVGVTKIVPLWSDRTIIKVGTSLGKQKLERWQRIAQEAAELSWRTVIPEISAPQSFRDFVTASSLTEAQSYLCVTHDQTEHLFACLRRDQQTSPNSAISILIGAEGGWTAAEEALAIAHNWQPVSLGNRILSAVTAPVVALAIVSTHLECP
jgi:16S rRNA (uracil1498-N3)-methyltransferase